MDTLAGVINKCLEDLRLRTDADFSAFACQEPGETAIRWKYAVGNKNERFRRIVLRLGKGIAGKVWMSGRPMVLENYEPRQHDDPQEYPILYAEELRSALGVPVLMAGRVKGVLLIGYRNPCAIEEVIVGLTKQSSKEMENIIGI
jgi:nitrogen regulatory protein A